MAPSGLDLDVDDVVAEATAVGEATGIAGQHAEAAGLSRHRGVGVEAEQLRRGGLGGLVEPGHADELQGYPGVDRRHRLTGAANRLFVPLVLRAGDAELRLFSTVTTFATPLDMTVAELAIESSFPADAATAANLRRAATAATGATAPG